MSIFPDYAERDRAPHKQGAGADAPSQTQSGEETASSKTNKPQHRFDKLAIRVAGQMIFAIRTALSVFSLPDKDRWTTGRLLHQLRGAEDLAREMLREIAATIFISSQKVRERSELGAFTSTAFRAERAPYFRLRVKVAKLDSPEIEDADTMGRSPERSEPEGHTSNAQAQVPGEAGIAPSIIEKTAPSPLTPSQCLRSPLSGRGGRNAESLFANRLEALEDVLAHPGKHAARMARALYRAEHGPGERLIARDEDDVLLDHAIQLANNPHHNDSAVYQSYVSDFIDTS